MPSFHSLLIAVLLLASATLVSSAAASTAHSRLFSSFFPETAHRDALKALQRTRDIRAAHNETFAALDVRHRVFESVRERSELFRLQRARRNREGFKIIPQANYISMRDGTKMFVLVWTPETFTKPLPTVFIRSPYGAYGTENMAELYLLFGFVAVEENVRGTGFSGGNFSFWHNAWQDGQDTMKWIVQQPWSDSVIHSVGASADGLNSLLDQLVPEPHLHTAWLVFTTGSTFDIAYPSAPGFAGNAYRQRLTHHWLDKLRKLWRPNAKRYDTTAIENEAYDEFWNGTYLPATDYAYTVPAIFNAGFYDIFAELMLDTYHGVNRRHAARTKLVIGPRGHCINTNPFIDLGARESYYFGYEMSLALFGVRAAQLRRELGAPQYTLDKVTIWVMGPTDWGNVTSAVPPTEQGNYWSTFGAWPHPKQSSERYYLDAGSWALLEAKDKAFATGSATLNYNPLDPTPTIGGNNLFWTCGAFDQRSNELRADNLVFTTKPFPAPRAYCGNANVTLVFESNATDTDFVVRVTDVWPDGHSMLLQDMAARMRWRTFHQRAPAFLTPHTVYTTSVQMWDTCMVINAHHSLRVTVTSSNFPRFSANLNNGKLLRDIIGDIKVAQNTIYTGDKGLYSYVDVPFVELADLPKNVN